MVSRARWVVGLALTSTLMSGVFVGCGPEGGDLAIRDIDPRSGALQGATVKIVGNNFRTDIGYTVYFGNQEAESVTILDSETLAMIAPTREEAGPVDVLIRADDGAAFRIREGFRYEDMGGNVVEGLGETKAKKGKLRF